MSHLLNVNLNIQPTLSLKISPWRTLIFNVQPTFIQHKKERQCGGNVVLTLGHNLTYIQRSTNVGITSCVSWVNTVYDGPNHFHEILPHKFVNLRHHKDCCILFRDKSKVARTEKRKMNTPVQENLVVTLVPDETCILSRNTT